MRPYIICHMVASIDGRIDCAMVEKISGDEYYSTLEELDCPSLLEGRVTMEHYNAAKEPFVPIITNNIEGVPLICIVSEKASEEYLETLRQQDISWIAVGKDGIDLAKAMEVLYERFGVKRLGLLGGGHINGGFLEAGLIDEVSLLLAPGIDGRTGETSLFDGISDKGRMPVQLRLEQVKKLKNDVLWIRYKL